MNNDEIRLRCIEAAAKAPIVHNDGPAAGVMAVAQTWARWVVRGTEAAPANGDAEAYWNDMAAERVAARPVLGVPKK